MKLFTKTKGGTQTSFDVPASTVAGAAGVLAIVQALSTLFASWFVTLPSNKAEMKLKERNFKIQTLQRVLENSSNKDRANSLKLLIAAELLDDEKGEVMKIANDSASVPKWDVHPIESMGGTFTTPVTSGAPSTSQTGTTTQNQPK